MHKDSFGDGMDSFWDLASLVPTRKRAPAPAFAASVSSVEVGSTDPTDPTDGECRFTNPPPQTPTAPVTALEYDCADNRFITHVRILRRPSDYNFYGQFCRDAKKYLAEDGEACPFVPLFSYIPQYAQLTPEQLAYYLYWRSLVRRGEYIRTDASYFYLYVYEIINLPDVIPPKDGILLLCNVWAAYRKALPAVDKFMTEWVMDYCLLHGLACPHERLHAFLPDILPLASHKEFYLGAMGDYGKEGTETALAFFSTYRFRDSRYLKGEEGALFEEHILGAMSVVLSHLLQSQKDVVREAARTVRSHEAFCGALCARHIRCRLELTYYSVRDVAFLRTSVTAAVKYAENRIRAALSIKSRLTVPPLEPRIKEWIDSYFAHAEAAIRPKKDVPTPVYERLYDAPAESTDLSRAARIERESWSTTRALVPEEEWDEIQNQTKTEVYFSAEAKNEENNEQGLTAAEYRYLSCLLLGDTRGTRALLAELGALEDEIAGAINEKGMERIGDIVLEVAEDGYTLIPDYMEEVSEWIREMKK